jgi:hypothetical protein
MDQDGSGAERRRMGTNGGSSSRGKEATSTANPGEEKHTTDPPGILRDPLASTARKYNTEIPHILPHERVFPIQIGSELFRLSGASLSSDGMCFPGKKVKNGN